MQHRELVQLITEYCARTGTLPEDVARDRFRYSFGDSPPEGLSGAIRTGWVKAKSAASKGLATRTPTEVVPPRHRVKGVSTYVGADGQVKGQWIKTDSPEETKAEMIRRVASEISRDVAPAAPVETPTGFETTADELLAVYPIGDPHFGMLAWEPESGASFDLKIAESLFVTAIRDLVRRGPSARQAFVCSLGDTFHFDNLAHHTTRGDHALDIDGRTLKVLRVGLRILIAMIDAAREKHELVTVDVKTGNHDGMVAIMTSLALEAHYRNEPRVKVIVSPKVRFYTRFGQCLIGTTHGDKGRRADLANLMAGEASEDWGATKHRYWYVGHVHHESVKEHIGCRVETFRTLAPRDSWHAGQGYLSGRDLQRITLHRDHGEISREVASVGYLAAKYRIKV